ncbi:histone H2B type W-T-like [Castor canadensis]|uniref:Histone H2B type W-T-like n=1 Tax=Castor canadensis TaxID=51338 RepID=A0A8B7TQW6_CASCN
MAKQSLDKSAETTTEMLSEEDLVPQETEETNSTSQTQEKPRHHHPHHHPGCGDSLEAYFPWVLKMCQRGLTLSQETMGIMDSCVHDILDGIASEAGHLSCQANHSTITASDIQKAVHLLLPREVSNNAVH